MCVKRTPPEWRRSHFIYWILRSVCTDTVQKLEELGYTLLDSYTNCMKRVEMVDKDGYQYFCPSYHIVAGHSPDRFGKANPHTIQNIHHWLALNGKSFILLSDRYVDARSHLEFRCNICGNAFLLSWNSVKNGCGCRHCKYAAQADIMRTNATKHGKFIDEYPRLRDEWCFDRNEEDITSLSSMSPRKVWWRCAKCGHEWQTSISHRTKDNSGCPKCKHSKGEDAVSAYLDKKNIKYISQRWFSDCRDARPLPFDFYLPEHNACIEFQGMQHYVPVDFRCHKVSDDPETIERFEALQRRDEIKRNYCLANNIRLLEIPYTAINEVDELISTFLDGRMSA